MLGAVLRFVACRSRGRGDAEAVGRSVVDVRRLGRRRRRQRSHGIAGDGDGHRRHGGHAAADTRRERLLRNHVAVARQRGGGETGHRLETDAARGRLRRRRELVGLRSSDVSAAAWLSRPAARHRVVRLVHRDDDGGGCRRARRRAAAAARGAGGDRRGRPDHRRGVHRLLAATLLLHAERAVPAERKPVDRRTEPNNAAASSSTAPAETCRLVFRVFKMFLVGLATVVRLCFMSY